VISHAEEREFFKLDRVFAMLWSEVASPSSRRRGSENSRATLEEFSISGDYKQRTNYVLRRFGIIRAKPVPHYAMAWYVSLF
jgi:hypothetical protein